MAEKYEVIAHAVFKDAMNFLKGFVAKFDRTLTINPGDMLDLRTKKLDGGALDVTLIIVHPGIGDVNVKMSAADIDLKGLSGKL
jgi:hypothetical protein